MTPEQVLALLAVIADMRLEIEQLHRELAAALAAQQPAASDTPQTPVT